MKKSIQRKSDSGDILRQDSRKGSARYTPMEREDKKEIQYNIHDGRNSQKDQWNPGVSNRAEEAGKIIIEKVAGIPAKMTSR